MAYTLSDEMKIFNRGWPWRSLKTSSQLS